jgi:hypothetical protein
MASFFSVLYYYADIWLTPALKSQIKQLVLSALQICRKNYDRMVSFKQLQTMAKQALPMQMLKNRHALMLHRIYKDHHRAGIEFH